MKNLTKVSVAVMDGSDLEISLERVEHIRLGSRYGLSAHAQFLKEAISSLPKTRGYIYANALRNSRF